MMSVIASSYPLSLPLSSMTRCCSNNNKNNKNSNNQAMNEAGQVTYRCLRCNTLYNQLHNSLNACSYHGHITGERGLYAMAPPHQGIDGEWTDKSGVIVYKWNPIHDRPNTGRDNWKKRWSCCSEYDPNAPPCRCGCHVSYDNGFTLY